MAHIYKDPEQRKEERRQYIKRFYASPAGRYLMVCSNARRRGVEVGMTRNEFVAWYNAQDKRCYYCSQPLVPGRTAPDSLVIERKDKAKGYIPGNVALACRRCNGIKGFWLTEQQMLGIGKEYKRKRDSNMDKSKDNLPRIMTAIRKALGLSQSELAELTGTSRQMLSYYETGAYEPTATSLDSWILGVKLTINKLKEAQEKPKARNTD